jgi:hypothetical protein
VSISKGCRAFATAHIFPRHDAGTAQRVTLPSPRQRPPSVSQRVRLVSGGSLYRRAHFAEKSWRGILEFQRNSQTRISIPDTPTAETAVTIAQIMSLIIRPYYPRYGRPTVQNCTEQGSNRCDLTAGPTGGLLGLTRRTGLPGRAARGSASPRKASSGERYLSWSKVADARNAIMGKAPGAWNQGLPRPWG